jgi:hypothetical protein
MATVPPAAWVAWAAWTSKSRLPGSKQKKSPAQAGLFLWFVAGFRPQYEIVAEVAVVLSP